MGEYLHSQPAHMYYIQSQRLHATFVRPLSAIHRGVGEFLELKTKKKAKGGISMSPLLRHHVSLCYAKASRASSALVYVGGKTRHHVVYEAGSLLDADGGGNGLPCRMQAICLSYFQAGIDVPQAKIERDGGLEDAVAVGAGRLKASI